MENSSGSAKSRITLAPGSFRHGGSVVVGLGIVAAMTDARDPVEYLAAPSKSSPIAIVSSAARAASNFRCAVSFSLERNDDGEVEVDESSESYTCVITHLSGDAIRKRVYVDGKLNCVEDFDCARSAVSRAGVFSASPADFGEFDGVFWTKEFLNSCFLCTKQLHGLDIFMYRGEKAFCSCDCREKHIRGEDYREKKCSSKHRSASPCSSPHVFLPQVAAA